MNRAATSALTHDLCLIMLQMFRFLSWMSFPPSCFVGDKKKKAIKHKNVIIAHQLSRSVKGSCQLMHSRLFFFFLTPASIPGHRWFTPTYGGTSYVQNSTSWSVTSGSDVKLYTNNWKPRCAPADRGDFLSPVSVTCSRYVTVGVSWWAHHSHGCREASQRTVVSNLSTWNASR